MTRKLMFAAMLPLAAGGCLAKTAFDVATAPVKVAGKAVDWTTTSQDEADRNYGRKMRHAEAREGAERKRWERECTRRQRDDCDRYKGYRASDGE